MDMWLATLAIWAQKLSAWLQNATGLAVKDIALFAGGIATVFALLLLGLYSGKPRHREAAQFGWFLLLVAAILLGYGLYHHNLVRAW